MDIVNKILRKLKIFDEPGFYIAIAAVFFLGVGVAPSLSDRNLSLLIGFFVALTAFIGVIYSKHKELVLKKHEISLQKVEDFSVNLFQWLESMDNILTACYSIKKADFSISIDMFSDEHSGLKKDMTNILTRKGRHLAFLSLYNAEIVNDKTKDLLASILSEQDVVMESIHHLITTPTYSGVEICYASASKRLKNIRVDAEKLVSGIEVGPE